jgi:nucleoporin GLE1
LQMISIVKSRNPKDKTFGNLAFACGYVMLLVTNQVSFLFVLQGNAD